MQCQACLNIAEAQPNLSKCLYSILLDCKSSRTSTLPPAPFNLEGELLNLEGELLNLEGGAAAITIGE